MSGRSDMRDIIAPHGGALVDRVADDRAARELLAESARLPVISLDERSVCDVVCLALGVYSPLDGFVGSADYRSIIESLRLADGTIWPIPIVLPVPRDAASGLREGSTVALANDGSLLARMEIEELYEADHPHEVRAVFGTDDVAHPGVFSVVSRSSLYAAGPITLLQAPPTQFPAESLTPAQTRAAFRERGWRTVAGFQTRNPVHRAHEYLQKVALEMVDGLLLHPLVGATKDDDVPADVRMRCYRTLLERYYPRGRTMLAVFPAAMRYAGPREAVLHAIARKNYGCSHFIVGRDHAGVGNYYGTYDAQHIFDSLEDELGMTILRFEHAFWCKACESMATTKTCPHPSDDHVTLSGSKVRELLRSGQRPPAEFSRPEVADILIAAMAPAEARNA